MDVILVPGSPYMTFVFDNATPRLTVLSYGVKEINNAPIASVSFPGARCTLVTLAVLMVLFYRI